MHNALIAGAAADIALEQFADLALAGARMLVAQIDRAHDHAGGAKAALKPMAVFEGGLHGMHGAVGFGQTLDGGDLGAAGLRCQHIAGLDRMAIHQHGAGAALGGVAAHMGAGQLQTLTQKLHQQRMRWSLHLLALSVDLEFDLHGCGSPGEKRL